MAIPVATRRAKKWKNVGRHSGLLFGPVTAQSLTENSSRQPQVVFMFYLVHAFCAYNFFINKVALAIVSSWFGDRDVALRFKVEQNTLFHRPHLEFPVLDVRYSSWLEFSLTDGVWRENQIIISVYLIGRGKHVSCGVTAIHFKLNCSLPMWPHCS